MAEDTKSTTKDSAPSAGLCKSAEINAAIFWIISRSSLELADTQIYWPYCAKLSVASIRSSRSHRTLLWLSLLIRQIANEGFLTSSTGPDCHVCRKAHRLLVHAKATKSHWISIHSWSVQYAVGSSGLLSGWFGGSSSKSVTSSETADAPRLPAIKTPHEDPISHPELSFTPSDIGYCLSFWCSHKPAVYNWHCMQQASCTIVRPLICSSIAWLEFAPAGYGR